MTEGERIDRSSYPTRRITLGEEGREPAFRGREPGELVAMVAELTRQAWIFKYGRWDEPRVRRDVVRTFRRGR